jgi:dihydroorotate dehydrogenase electron transfer subunit
MLPASARRVGLVAFNDSPRRLLALLDATFKQDASVTLVCEHPPEDLPLQVEVQPLGALAEVCQWADYVAFDTRRESLLELREKIGKGSSFKSMSEAQVLVDAPMPCGGLAECGVCTVEVHGGHCLACVDGPVFDLTQLIG